LLGVNTILEEKEVIGNDEGGVGGGHGEGGQDPKGVS
jgi:hypothetical protein